MPASSPSCISLLQSASRRNRGHDPAQPTAMFKASTFSLGGASKPLDPASEISRLLNQHTHHWQTLEKEIEAVRRKRQDAEKVYAAALQAKEEARAAALTADSEVVGLEAECAHCRAEVQAGQAANTTLHADLDAQKEELAGITTTADLARQEFMQEVDSLLAALKKIKAEHPGTFMVDT